MKISTPVIILGVAVILIIIVVLLATSGGDDDDDEIVEEENDNIDGIRDPSLEYPNEDVYEDDNVEDTLDEHNQHMLQQQEPDPPFCDIFEGCPDNLEVNTGQLGDTEVECCIEPECPSDICPASEFKKPIPGARGSTVDQCCIDALCDVSMCNENEFLKPDADKGFNSSDCCQEKPLCSTTFDCTGEYEPKTGPPIPKGSTRDECCDLKLCSANGYTNEICGNVGMKSKVGGVRGKSVEECCEMDTCRANMDRNDDDAHPFKWENGGQCPAGTSFEFTTNDQLGNKLSDCCSMASCKDNGWDDSECKFKSGNKKTLKYGDPRGDSVNECCDEKLCENNYYFDTRKSCIDGNDQSPTPAEPGPESPCYHMGNTNQKYQSLPEVDIDGNDRRRPNTPDGRSGDMKQNCAYFNMKMSPKGTKMPFDEGKNTETCCKPLSCKEYSEIPGSGITTECPSDDEGKPGVFLSDKIIPLSEITDPNTGKAVPTQDKCCATAKCSESYSDEICSDKFDEMQSESSDPNNFTHPFPYGDSQVIIYTGEHLEYNKSNDPEPSSIETCCKPKKCNEVNYTCPDTHIKKTPQPSSVVSDENCCIEKTCANSPFNCAGAGRTNKSVAPTTGKWDVETCCEPIRCNDVGWTEDKCKDRTLTRAAYRGKMKRDPNDPSKYASIGGLSNLRARPGGRPESVSSPGSIAGDKQCCEQSKDNFARQCVGEMWSEGRLENGSVGADSAQHLVQIGSKRTATSPDACKALCVADSNCTSFRSTANTGKNRNEGGTTSSPNCELYRGFRSSESGDVQYKVVSEFSASPVHTHYVSNETYPETIRYSGGSLQTIEQVKEDNHSPTKPGYDGAEVWEDKENVYLAGVDKEFCPYRFVKGFGIFNDGGHGGAYYGGTWADIKSSASDPFKGRDTNYTTKGGTQIANTKGDGCYGGTHHPLWGETEFSQTERKANHIATTPLRVSEALDACYTEDDCHWAWFNAYGHWADSADSKLTYQTRWDPATNYIWKKTAKTTKDKRCSIQDSGGGLNGSNANRRVCMAGAPNKEANTEPQYYPEGGASMYMTRNKVSNSEEKYRVGTMPYKTKFKPRHWYSGPDNWSPLLISGDNTEAPSF